MNLLLKRSLFLGTAGYTLYDFNSDEKLLLRGARTLRVGLKILYNYKIAFNENNVDEIHEDTARSVYELCRDNDGLYVKFGQQVAASEHTLPPVYLKYFCQLQDKAQSSPNERIEQLLKEEIGDKSKIFKEFDPEPVAAASIAQVHKATLHDGTQVAVKIQKPNIKRQFKSDMFAHWLFCFALDYAFDLPLLSFQETIEENLEKEIDFSIEASNAERVRNDLKYKLQRQNVYVPKIYHEYTTHRVMIMEWIDAIKITDQEKLEKNNFNIPKLLNTCIETFAEQIFISGFVHCDPHPGNLMARKIKNKYGKEEDQIIMLDFGLCIPVKEQFRLQYCKFWENLFLNNQKEMKEIVKQWGIQDEEMFATAQLMRPFNKDKHINQKISKEEVFKMQQKFKEDFKKMLGDTSKFPDELIFIGRNMNLVRSLNKRMGSIVNRVNVMAKYAVKGRQYKNVENIDDLSKQIIHQNSAFSHINLHVLWFQCRLMVSGVIYNLIQFWLKFTKNSNFEEAVENKLKQVMDDKFEKYGMKIDEHTFNA